MQRESQIFHPLVMAFIGPSGVGKSETSFRISQALFNKPTDPIDHIPRQLLTIRGEDYSLSSNMIINHGIVETRQQLKQIILQHLIKTNGEAIIVFDEMQKAVPDILEIFLPALEHFGQFSSTSTSSSLPSTASTSTTKPTTSTSITLQNYSTRHVVFLFISDIGKELLEQMILKHYDRQHLDILTLKNEVKILFDQQFPSLYLGKTIEDVIPFLPLEPFHIFDILTKQINQTRVQGQLYQRWLNLILEDSLIDMLALSDAYKYEEVIGSYIMEENNNNETVMVDNEIIMIKKYFAKWGARGGTWNLFQSFFTKMKPWQPSK
jgi:ATP-dependent Clp protease ATP-binding subunit ClpA